VHPADRAAKLLPAEGLARRQVVRVERAALPFWAALRGVNAAVVGLLLAAL
jgi:hypothetical protein